MLKSTTGAMIVVNDTRDLHSERQGRDDHDDRSGDRLQYRSADDPQVGGGTMPGFLLHVNAVDAMHAHGASDYRAFAAARAS